MVKVREEFGAYFALRTKGHEHGHIHRQPLNSLPARILWEQRIEPGLANRSDFNDSATNAGATSAFQGTTHVSNNADPACLGTTTQCVLGVSVFGGCRDYFERR